MNFSKLVFIFILTLSCKSFSQGCLQTVNINKELFITDATVIDNAEASEKGSLSFYSIFKKFSRTSTDKNIRQALLQWLDEWNRKQLDSGVEVTPRSTSSLKWFWPKDHLGELSLEDAPFVLSSIVFRPDLMATSKQSGRLIDGELRFIYNLIDAQNGSAEQFSLIFEFPLFADQGLDWVAQIHDLGKMDWDNRYLKKIIDITNKLDQQEARLRTNEFYLAFEWDLREFQVNNKTGQIQLQPLPKTPRLDFDMTPDLTTQLQQWILGSATAIQSGDYELPLLFQTGNAPITSESFGWMNTNPSIAMDEKLRHQFSIQSCNGCHASETKTRFTHIEPRSKKGSVLHSEFLDQDLLVRKQILESRLCRQPVRLKQILKGRQGRVH